MTYQDIYELKRVIATEIFMDMSAFDILTERNLIIIEGAINRAYTRKSVAIDARKICEHELINYKPPIDGIGVDKID